MLQYRAEVLDDDGKLVAEYFFPASSMGEAQEEANKRFGEDHPTKKLIDHLVRVHTL